MVQIEVISLHRLYFNSFFFSSPRTPATGFRWTGWNMAMVVFWTRMICCAMWWMTKIGWVEVGVRLRERICLHSWLHIVFVYLPHCPVILSLLIFIQPFLVGRKKYYLNSKMFVHKALAVPQRFHWHVLMITPDCFCCHRCLNLAEQ